MKAWALIVFSHQVQALRWRGACAKACCGRGGWGLVGARLCVEGGGVGDSGLEGVFNRR